MAPKKIKKMEQFKRYDSGQLSELLEDYRPKISPI
jgi:hypothetical protein